MQIQHVELFHLLFLAQLSRKVDKTAVVLKGGANLRFFFRSLRYSEDMDLDVAGVEVHKLRDRVAGILASAPFRQILEVRGLAIEHVTEHKQTETTQRWKLGLLLPRSQTPTATRIEFSRRGLSGATRFESIDPALVRFYELPPVMITHYTAGAAFQQKIEALLTRSATQARDIFDLHLLLSTGAGTKELPDDLRRRLPEARSKVLAMTFDEFKSQVVAYLSPEDQPVYDARDAWDTMQLEVVEALEGGGT